MGLEFELVMGPGQHFWPRLGFSSSGQVGSPIHGLGLDLHLENFP